MTTPPCRCITRTVPIAITFSGLEGLDPERAYLFMSNHRDIALDPAIICLGLTSVGRNTVRIAIGDNLLSKPFRIRSYAG